MSNSLYISPNLTNSINNSSKSKVKKRLSITIVKDNPNILKLNSEKINTPLKLKENENEKINEREEIIIKENEQLKDEITKLKVKHLNMEFENETKIVKYKNIIKGIEKQCQNLGIKLDLKFENI